MNGLKLASISGIVIAIAGVAAGAIVFAMDDTYPEEFPGWAAVLFWIGVIVAVGAGITRGVLKNR